MTPSKCNTLFNHKTHVRIDDINFGNHLCHSKFINIIHNARALFLKSHNLSESNCFGCGLVMLNLNIEYVSQCFFDDLLEVSLDFDKRERSASTFKLSYSVFNHTSNKLAARAITLMGFLDIEKRKLKRIPIEFLNLIDNLRDKSISL